MMTRPMLIRIAETCRKASLGVAVAALASLTVVPAHAQSIESVDPDLVIDADLDANIDGGVSSPAFQLDEPSTRYDTPTATVEAPPARYANATLDLPPEVTGETYPAPATAQGQTASRGNGVLAADNILNGAPVDAANANPAVPNTTYGRDDLLGAAEGVFGAGAEGMAGLIENLLAEQGEPNGYIVGREGGAAFVLGVRYGSGTLFHAIEGNMPVYWTGPSIGFDAGANAGNTFVLVYNLDDSADLYRRFPAGEGQLYIVGGFNASYMRRGNIVLIPIRVGAGLRIGVNAGYMKFSRSQRWLPF